jgi:hypothetical protein
MNGRARMPASILKIRVLTQFILIAPNRYDKVASPRCHSTISFICSMSILKDILRKCPIFFRIMLVIRC